MSKLSRSYALLSALSLASLLAGGCDPKGVSGAIGSQPAPKLDIDEKGAAAPTLARPMPDSGGVTPTLPPQIDPLHGAGHTAKHSLENRLRPPRYRHHGAVVVAIAFKRQHVGPCDRSNRGDNGLNRPGVGAFREVRNRFNQNAGHARCLSSIPFRPNPFYDSGTSTRVTQNGPSAVTNA